MPPGPATQPHRNPAPSWRPGTFRALRHYNYRLYFFGQVVSLTGSWLQTAALMWLAYQLTDEAVWPALISTAQVVPTLLLGLYGGGLADRLPRRPLIFAAQSAMLALSLVLAVMVLTNTATPAGLLVVSLLLGVTHAIDTPARLAFVIDMVGRDDLINAVALNSLVFNLARMVGPGLYAALRPLVGDAGCFLLNGVTFVAVLGALAAMRLPPRSASEVERPAGSVREGFALLGRRRGLLLLVVLAGALAFFGWPLLSLLPAVSDRMLNSGEEGYSLMLAAVGAGALLGALAVATFGTPGRRPVFLTAGVLAGVAALAGLAVTTKLAVAVYCCGLSGAGLILYFATGQAMMQLGADEHNRGRVMGIWLMVLSGAQPAGNVVFGWLADRWEVWQVMLLCGAGITATAAVVSGLVFAWGTWAEGG